MNVAFQHSNPFSSCTIAPPGLVDTLSILTFPGCDGHHMCRCWADMGPTRMSSNTLSQPQANGGKDAKAAFDDGCLRNRPPRIPGEDSQTAHAETRMGLECAVSRIRLPERG